jgi:phosphatidylinositol N-acetylglucosaminyltransferase subunit C
MWDWWVGQEEASNSGSGETNNAESGEAGSSASSTTGSVSHGMQGKETNGTTGLGLKLSTSASNIQRPSHSHSTSATSVHSNTSVSPAISPQGNGGANFGHHGFHSQYGTSTSLFSPRNQQRLATAKSAILIYYALLGLSPILKSLTRSTTSDSIWAMSAWLMCINVFFFDYGGEVK